MNLGPFPFPAPGVCFVPGVKRMVRVGQIGLMRFLGHHQNRDTGGVYVVRCAHLVIRTHQEFNIDRTKRIPLQDLVEHLHGVPIPTLETAQIV